MLILFILLCVVLLLWFVSCLPLGAPALAPYNGWFAFISVLLLTIIVGMHFAVFTTRTL